VRRFVSAFLLVSAIAVFAMCPIAAKAQITMTVQQVGGNVVVQASGSANTGSLTFRAVPRTVGEIDPISYIYVSGSATGQSGTPLNVGGPSSFGSGGYVAATSSSGDCFGIWFGNNAVILPDPYVSGTYLSGSATYNLASIASLGLSPGTYTWTWGSGATADSLVLTITAPAPTPSPSPSVVPSLSQWAQLMLGLMVISMLGWHFHRERSY